MNNRKTRYPTECQSCGAISPRNYQRCRNCNRWLLNTDLQRKNFTQLVKELAGDFVVKWHKGEIKSQERRLIG